MTPTVKVTAKLDRELWAQLRACAVREGTTASKLVTRAIREYLQLTDHFELETGK